MASCGRHPVVEAWLEEGFVVHYLRRLPKPLDPITQSHLDLALAVEVEGRGPKEAALSQAEKALPEIKDPLYAVLYMSLASYVALLAGRKTESWAYYHRAHSLLSRDMPPEFKAANISLKSRILGTEGNKSEQIRLHQEALAALPVKSPHYGRILHSFGVFLAELGRESDIDEEYARRIGEPTLSQARIIQYVETGRFAEARKLHSRLSEADRKNLDSLYTLDLQSIPSDAPPWAAVIGRLLARRPDEALQLARKLAHEDSDRYLAKPTLESFNLVRAELSSGNGETARRLMKLRHERGNVHYVDDLFLARIERLAGRVEDAGRCMMRLMDSADRYHAHGRVDFEMKMACELEPVEWLQLMRPRSNPKAKARRIEEAPSGIDRLIGTSQAIQDIRKAIKRFAPLDATVLITGETGTGKEIVARALHEEGPRADEPLVTLNCGAISESLLESELFGYERGAFTGAQAARAGFIEQAGRGTLVLDEIGEISSRLQVALLRVLESRDYFPVGGRKVRRMECRILASTNRSLAELEKEGRFRRDLLYRLRQLEIDIPPLRDRVEDVAVLAEHFLNLDRSTRASIHPSLKREWSRYDWPGNVRELKHDIERMRLLHPELHVYESGHIIRTSSPKPRHENLLGVPAKRLGRLKELFQERGRLTRKEISALLGVSVETVNQDLHKLMKEGFVERVSPSASSRTNYFACKHTCKPREQVRPS